MKKIKATTRPGKTHRPALSREAISQAALDLIDRDGLEALSMRRLGAVLKVEAMSLYHHFDSKGKLLDAVMERLLDEVVWPARGTVEPMQRIRQFMKSYRELSIRHPHAFVLLVYRRFNTDHTFELYERFLEALADLGLDAATSACYFRMIGYYVNGAGMAEIASHAAQPDATPVALEDFHQGERFPHIAEVVPHLRVDKLQAIYDFGLETIFREMQASAEALQKRKPGA